MHPHKNDHYYLSRDLPETSPVPLNTVPEASSRHNFENLSIQRSRQLRMYHSFKSMMQTTHCDLYREASIHSDGNNYNQRYSFERHPNSSTLFQVPYAQPQEVSTISHFLINYDNNDFGKYRQLENWELDMSSGGARWQSSSCGGNFTMLDLPTGSHQDEKVSEHSQTDSRDRSLKNFRAAKAKISVGKKAKKIKACNKHTNKQFVFSDYENICPYLEDPKNYTGLSGK
ncbi:hypothetical protein O181_033550 [Austropuccinia psidii MF-1]|uniref:Uncharacterized protein n=1 Tax=Austropuccinia psidii MF-1 TaxID=1389203 RepID=A0A9Q3D395_9BASI|nr:hypothetical protein [Austropuccinia psidii MF-1]